MLSEFMSIVIGKPAKKPPTKKDFQLATEQIYALIRADNVDDAQALVEKCETSEVGFRDIVKGNPDFLAQANSFDMVNMLLSKGGEVNKASINGIGDCVSALCALMIKFQGEPTGPDKFIPIAKLLIDDYRANINFPSSVYKNNILSFCDNIEIMIFLIRRGANIHHKNYDGKTVLEVFVERPPHSDGVKLLKTLLIYGGTIRPGFKVENVVYKRILLGNGFQVE